MPCGPHCACIGEDFECLSVLDPIKFGFFRQWCESGDESKRMHVRERSRLGIITPVEETTVAMTSPGFVDMAKSFMGTMVQEAQHVISGGDVTVSEEVFQRRLAICRGQLDHWSRCQYLQEHPILQCGACGCLGDV